MHRRVWSCRFHSSLVFTTKQNLERHLRDEDHGFINGEQIAEFANIAQSVIEDDRSQCPICLEVTACVPQFAAHLAHHLERIAVFSLPLLSDARDSSVASHKAAPQSIDDQDTLPSVLSDCSWFESAQDDSVHDVQKRRLGDKIVQWLLEFAYLDPQKVPLSLVNPPSLQSFLERSDISSWRNGSSPQWLICCSLDQTRLVSLPS